MANSKNENQKPEVRANLRMMKGSPRKVNLVLQMIRGKSIGSAVKFLLTCRKYAAIEVRKLLNAAIANAENNHGLDVDMLIVKEAYVGKAMVLKRWHARARGRVGRIKKPYSRVDIILTEQEE